MKSFSIMVIGLAIALGFLVSAALSQQASYAGHSGTGAVIRSAPQDYSTPDNGIGGPQGNGNTSQNEGPFGYWMNWYANSSGNEINGLSGEPYIGWDVPRCLGVAGGTVAC